MLDINFCGIKMKNPIVAASGTFGLGLEFLPFLNYKEDVGAVSIKGLTLEPRSGNKGVRIAEAPSGMINCVGLENPGVDSFIKNYLPYLQKQDVPVIANISGNSVDEYGIMAAKFAGTGVAGIEVNISCPNVKEGGMAFGTCPKMAARVTRMVKQRTDLPVIIKLSPNVTDIVSIAKAVEAAGADGISMINTVLGMSVNMKTWEPQLGNVYGGLSGPAIKPIALRMVHQVAREVKIPIMGMGGIMTGEDALSFMLVGASAVQVGTANLIDPRSIKLIADQMEEYLQGRGLNHVTEIINQIKEPNVNKMI